MKEKKTEKGDSLQVIKTMGSNVLLKCAIKRGCSRRSPWTLGGFGCVFALGAMLENLTWLARGGGPFRAYTQMNYRTDQKIWSRN